MNLREYLCNLRGTVYIPTLQIVRPLNAKLLALPTVLQARKAT